ncbi:MAG: hypothetical protein H6652_03625 [Ardenticatenaceae bacterium]|nr:hypothetical protein [Ardenticatenaceae bacterium]
MTAWNDTIKTALLGTNRAKLPTLPGNNALGQLLTQLPPQEDAASLLTVAGTVALHQQTGWQPRQNAPTPPTTNPPDLPVCQPHIAYQLDALLEGTQALLLPEMLEALAQTGHRAPEFLLPSLLDKGKKLSQARPAILLVLGQRGRWLAEQNPDWQYASPKVEHWVKLLEMWETAVPVQRHALLRQLRATHPKLGRQILERTWKNNSGLVRNQAIKTLDVNLSMDDEPFLEAALDDRDHLARRAAADLLAKLPQSRLAQRMTQHVAGILTWTPNHERAITVRLPKAITPAMLRDGIPTFKPEEKGKVQSRLLTQIINRVPLSYWTETWQKTPAEIVHAALNSGWPRTLIAGFSTAAIRQNEAAWAEAIILANEFNTSTGRLIPVLPADRCHVLVLQAAKQSTSLQRSQPLFVFLQHWQQPWPTELGEFWLDMFAQHLQQFKEKAPDPTLNNIFKRFGQKCDPQLADTAVTKLTTIPDLNNAWEKTVNLLCETLLLRRNLLAEIHRLNVDH